MEGLIETFYIDIKLIIAQLFNFAVVFVVLYIFAVKPLMKIMQERTAKIEKGLKDAEINSQLKIKIEEDYKKALASARSEAQQIVTQAKKEAEVKRSEMVSKAKEEVAQIVTQGKNQLAQEKLHMVQEAKEEVIDLVTEVVRKVLGESITPEIDRKIIEKNIKEL